MDVCVCVCLCVSVCVCVVCVCLCSEGRVVLQENQEETTKHGRYSYFHTYANVCVCVGYGYPFQGGVIEKPKGKPPNMGGTHIFTHAQMGVARSF